MKQALVLGGCQTSNRRGEKPDGKSEQHEPAECINRNVYWISHPILRPAVSLSHSVQILPAQPSINKADNVSQHDRTPLFDRLSLS